MSTKKKPCCGARSNSDAAVTVSEIAAADKPRTNPKRKSKAAPARANPKAATGQKPPRKQARKNLSADESSGGSKTPETAAPKGKKSGTTRTPVILQHTALQTYRGLRKEEPDPAKRRSKAFAIATASLQDAGVFTPESRKLTRYGRRIEREHTREDPEILARKLAAYERMLRAGSFDAAVAAGARPNPSAPCEWFVVLRDPKGPLSSLEIDSGWERREDADSRLAIVNLSVGQGVIQLFDGRKPEVSVLPRRTLEGVPPPVSRSNGRRRPRPNGATMPSSPLLQKIREAAEKAESYRLHNAHDQAKHLNAEVEHLRLRAEQAGLEQEAARAEHEGRQAARQQGKTPRSNPTARTPDPKLTRLFNLSRAQALTPSPQHPDFKTLEGQIKRAESDARKHGINPLLIEQAVEEGFMEGKGTAEARQNPRSNPTRRPASSNNAALRDRAKAHKFWDGVPAHMRAEVAEAVIEGFDWMDYPDVFEAPPSRAFRAELGRIVDLWEEAGGPLRRNGKAKEVLYRVDEYGRGKPHFFNSLSAAKAWAASNDPSVDRKIRWRGPSSASNDGVTWTDPEWTSDDTNYHIIQVTGGLLKHPPTLADVQGKRPNNGARRNPSGHRCPQCREPAKVNLEDDLGECDNCEDDHGNSLRWSLQSRRTPRRLHDEQDEHLALAMREANDARGNGSPRRNGSPQIAVDMLNPHEEQRIRQQIIAQKGTPLAGTPFKIGQKVLFGGVPWHVYDTAGRTSKLVLVSPQGTIARHVDLGKVKPAPATRRNPPPPPPAHGTRDQVVNVHFKPKNTAELRRFETALKSAVGSARVGIVEGSDFNPVTGSACIHLRGLSAQRLEAAVKPLVRSVAPRAVLTAARRNGEGCAACAASSAAPTPPAAVARANASRRRRNPESPQGLTTHLASTSPNRRGYFMCGERQDPQTTASSYEKATCYYCRLEDSRVRDALPPPPRTNPSRHRRNGLTDKPLAAAGLVSYRYEGPYGWIMIGAKDDADALSEANRSLEHKTASLSKLQVWEGDKYVPAHPSIGRKNLSRHRRNGEDEDLEEGSRFINIPPEVADLGQGWWSGQGDPLYAVLSRYYAGRFIWDVSGTRTLIEASPDEIQRLHDMANDTLNAYGKPGYNISDDEMDAAQSVLDGALEDIGKGARGALRSDVGARPPHRRPLVPPDRPLALLGAELLR